MPPTKWLLMEMHLRQARQHMVPKLRHMEIQQQRMAMTPDMADTLIKHQEIIPMRL